VTSICLDLKRFIRVARSWIYAESCLYSVLYKQALVTRHVSEESPQRNCYPAKPSYAVSKRTSSHSSRITYTYTFARYKRKRIIEINTYCENVDSSNQPLEFVTVLVHYMHENCMRTSYRYLAVETDFRSISPTRTIFFWYIHIYFSDKFLFLFTQLVKYLVFCLNHSRWFFNGLLFWGIK